MEETDSQKIGSNDSVFYVCFIDAYKVNQDDFFLKILLTFSHRLKQFYLEYQKLRIINHSTYLYYVLF